MRELRIPCSEHDRDHVIEFEFEKPEPGNRMRGGWNFYVVSLASCMCNAPTDDEIVAAIENHFESEFDEYYNG